MGEKWQEAGVPQISKFGSEIKIITITDTAPWTDTICKEVFEGLPDSKRDDIFSLWANETFLLSNFLGNVILWRCWYTKDYVAVWVDPASCVGLSITRLSTDTISSTSTCRQTCNSSPDIHLKMPKIDTLDALGDEMTSILKTILTTNLKRTSWQHILTTNLD